MKTKKLSKKLVLRKKTVAHLNNGEMTAIVGGIMTIDCASHSPVEPSCLCPDNKDDPTMWDCPPPY